MVTGKDFHAEECFYSEKRSSQKRARLMIVIRLYFNTLYFYLYCDGQSEYSYIMPQKILNNHNRNIDYGCLPKITEL